MEIGMIKTVNLDTEMRSAYLDYAMSVIVARALPDVRDGLKPVQRRVLYAMHGMGLRHNTSYRKSAGIVGEVLKEYHPHGDTAVYDALVRMAQDFSLRYPLVDGQGNFGCFTGDTKIKLLDGTEKRFAELAELGSDAVFYVYSVDETGRIVVGEGSNARVTRRDSPLVEVILDNGERIRCTPDHRFMLRDGTYKEAQHLTPEDSLMPAYFDTAPVKEGLNGYLRVMQPATGEYEFVHRIADNFNREREQVRRVRGPFVRHHKNFNRWDNSPTNIERLTFLEHLHVHAEQLKALWEDTEFRQAQREGVQRYYQEHPEALEERRKRFASQNRDAAFRQGNGLRVSASLKRHYSEDSEAKAEISRRMKALWEDPDYRAKMSAALAGIQKRELTQEEKGRVAQIISEKSRTMWGDDGKRAKIVDAISRAMALPEVRATISRNSRRLWQDPDYRAKYRDDHFSTMARVLWQDPATRELHQKKIARQWGDETFRTAQSEGVKRSNARRLQDNPQMMSELAQKAAAALTERWGDPMYAHRVMRQRIARYVSFLLTEVPAESITPEIYDAHRNANWIPRSSSALKHFSNFAELVEAGKTYNHRIVAVQWLDEREDVYDITVDKYHNFLMSSGVFVHNSVDGDPAAAMRYCVVGQSLVATDKGLIPIEELSPEGSEDIDIRVLSRDGTANRASKWWNCGAFPTRRVRTQRGYEVTGTLNHPLLVAVPHETTGRITLVWKLVSDIEPGDYLVLDRSEALWPEQQVDLRPFYPEFAANSRAEKHTLPEQLDSDFAFLLGSLLAEGTFRPQAVEFTNTHGDFADAFEQTWRRVFPTCRLHIFDREPVSYGKKPFRQMQVVSQQVTAFLNNLGLDGRSAQRQIPGVILRSPQSVAAAFLRGLFEGDGAVERSGSSLLRVSLCARNKALLQQAQTLLLRFGIVSALQHEEARDMYRLLIVGHDNLSYFQSNISFASDKKRQALAFILQLNTGRALSKSDYVPYLSEFVRANAQRGQREWLSRHNFDRTDRLTAVLPRLEKALPATDFTYIEQLAHTRYLFERVASVENAGEQKVYSLRVDSECHSFVANGFVNHNTESKMRQIAEELLADIDKETVTFVPNYDEKAMEPTVLPARVPNMLLNGASGIAVGMATNIPPHNLRELCDAETFLIDNPDATVEELMQLVPGPDFPTGGIIMGNEGIREAYATGRGRVVMRAKAYVEESRAGRYSIIVTELPFQVNKANLHEKIADLISDDRLPGASIVRDESDRNGMRLVIEMKRDAQPKKVLNLLFKYTPMQSTFGVNMLALVNGNEPRVLPLKKSLQHHIEWRHEVITRRTQFELRKAQERAHVLEGLKIALDNLDAVISTIRGSRTPDSAKGNLRTNFKLSEVQAQAILDMRLARLAALERKKIEDEYIGVIKEIGYLEDLLAHPAKIFGIIKADLADLKEKYGDDRRTRIGITNSAEFSEEDLIPDLQVLVTLTDRGYIKRMPHDSYKRQNRGGKGIIGMVTREMDAVQHMITCNTLDSLLFLTDKGKVYQLKAHEVPDASRQAKGLPLVNLVSLEPNEKVTGVISVRDFKTDGAFLVLATRQGKIKKTPLTDYSAVRSTGIIALNLEEGDELAASRLSHGNGDILVATRKGKAIRFPEMQVRPMGRATAGVTAIRLAEGDEVVGMDVVRPDSKASLLVVTTRGMGKRTLVKGFPRQGRAGGGVRMITLIGRAGEVAVARMAFPDDDLVVISTNGQVIRMFTDDIPHKGRPAQGVNVMNMREGDEIASIARIPRTDRSGKILGDEELEVLTEDQVYDAGMDGDEDGEGSEAGVGDVGLGNGQGMTEALNATVTPVAVDGDGVKPLSPRQVASKAKAEAPPPPVDIKSRIRRKQ